MTAPSTPELIEFSCIHRDVGAWPRRRLSRQRADRFRRLYREHGLDAVPPLLIVPHDDGAYLLADGYHRFDALAQLGAERVPALVSKPPSGMSPSEHAYEQAMAAAATSGLSLTGPEFEDAIRWTLTHRQGLSRADIAELCGVPTGDVRRVEMEDRQADVIEVRVHPDDCAAPGRARWFAEHAPRALWDQRPIADQQTTDRVAYERAGKRVAVAFRRVHGPDARSRLNHLRRILDSAASKLDRGEREGRQAA